MKKILIFLFFVVSSAAFAQPPYTASGFTYNGHTYKVSIVGDGIG